MSSEWYCRISGSESGPHASSTLAEMARSGRLQPTDFVRKSTNGNWAPAAAVQGLSFGTHPIQPVPPPPPPPPPSVNTIGPVAYPSQASPAGHRSIGHWIIVAASTLFILGVVSMLVQMVNVAWHQTKAANNSLSANELQSALIGNYEDGFAGNKSISLSFQYPNYVRRLTDGSAPDRGTFEVSGDHPMLHASGLAGTGVLAIVLLQESQAEYIVLLVKPILSDTKELQGIQAVGFFDKPLPAEQQTVLLYSGPPDFSSKPVSGKREFHMQNMPEFLPRSSPSF